MTFNLTNCKFTNFTSDFSLASQSSQFSSQPVSYESLNFDRSADLCQKLDPSIVEVVPEAKKYFDLLIHELAIDAKLARKKLAIQEAIKRPMRMNKKLRVTISDVFTSNDVGASTMFRLAVKGKFVDSESKPYGDKFSTYFKSIILILDEKIYGPSNHIMGWQRTPENGETDGFQVEQVLTTNDELQCDILLAPDFNPMKFKVKNHLLKMIIGINSGTLEEIYECLWLYIKSHRLQDPINHQVINCDKYLKHLFGRVQVRNVEIPSFIFLSITPLDNPIVFHHVVKPREPGVSHEVHHDIEIEVDNPCKTDMANFLQKDALMEMEDREKIDLLDEKISKIIGKLNETKTRYEGLDELIKDPINGCKKWLSIQEHEFKLISNTMFKFEEERRAYHYYQHVLLQGVHSYIYGEVQKKRKELEENYNNLLAL